MNQTITIDVPHQLGRATARARLDEGIVKTAKMVPGVAQVTHTWDNDTMNFALTALGQTIRCRATVFDDKVHAEIDLPAFLALIGNKVRETFGKELPKLLK